MGQARFVAGKVRVPAFRATLVAVAGAITIALAVLSWHLVERRALAWKAVTKPAQPIAPAQPIRA